MQVYDNRIDMTKKDQNINIVQFFEKALENKSLSRKAGKPVFEDKVYVRILTPGAKEPVERLMEELDRVRYPSQWEQYSKNQEQTAGGTPLAEMTPILGAAVVATLKASNFSTVEQLAHCPDSKLPKMRQEAKQKAVNFLAVRDGTADINSLQTQNEELAAQVAKLTDDLAYMKRRLAENEEKPAGTGNNGSGRVRTSGADDGGGEHES